MIIDDEGKLLIEKEVNPQVGEINKVYCQSGLYCINIINFESPRNTIAAFNRNGNQLWNNVASEPVQWCLTTSKEPVLVTATVNSIVLFDGLTGNQIDQKSYSTIYAEAGVPKLRKDGNAGVVFITNRPYSNQVSLLLSEFDEKKGNLIYSFNRKLDRDSQKVSISDSDEPIKVRATHSGLIVIKQGEMLKFEYTNEK